MPASYDKQIAVADKKAKLAAMKLQELRINQTYRALDDNHNRRRRKAPTLEVKGEDEQIGLFGRLKSVAKARDTRRNYSGAKATENQIWLNVIGTGPKVIVHDEENGEEWSNWFNSIFAKRCDGIGDRHLADQAKLVLTSVVREGDVLAYFDTEGVIPNAEGTVWYWEADQMPDINGKSFTANKSKIKAQLGVDGNIKQASGQIIDDYGRTVGYIVSKNHERGKATAKYADVTILPKDNCKFLYNPWRLNQRRGTSDYLEIANMWQDLERFTEALIQRSIVQSFLALKVTKEGGAVEGRGNIYDSENPNGIPDVTDDDASEGANYKNFEKLSMNAMEYLEPGEDIESVQLSGDLPDAQGLIDYMQGNAGWAQGLSAMYSTGKADASYSASMAEANMTWAMFKWWQKFVERYYFDWVAEMGFNWAQGGSKISAMPESRWLGSVSWHDWPKRKAINPVQESNSRKIDLEIGAIDYNDILGPNWKVKLKALGDQIKYGRDNGYFNPMFTPQTTRSSE